MSLHNVSEIPRRKVVKNWREISFVIIDTLSLLNYEQFGYRSGPKSGNFVNTFSAHTPRSKNIRSHPAMLKRDPFLKMA